MRWGSAMSNGRPNFPAHLRIFPNAPRETQDAWMRDSEQDIAQYGIAGRIWESAFLWAAYIENTTHTFDPPHSWLDAPVTLLELGAGVGTAGLATASYLAHRSACPSEAHHVILTDLPEVESLLRRNVPWTPWAQAHVHVRPLAWGDAGHAEVILQTWTPTHILCSDLIYFPELLAPLLRSLLQITQQAPNATVYLAYKIRSLTKEQPFWTGLSAWFDLTWVQCTPSDPAAPWRPFGTHASHFAYAPPCDETGAPLDDYFLFAAQRKEASLQWTCPDEDALLLQGLYMADGQPIPAPGTDAFEWILLSRSMDSDEL